MTANAITPDNQRYKMVQGKTNEYLIESADIILDQMTGHGAYVASANSGNVIIKFAEPKLGSLRISDQACDPQYCTRWNLTSGKFVKVESKYKSHWYREEDVHDLMEHINRYANTIARNNPPADVGQADSERNQDASYWAHQVRMSKEQEGES